MTLSYLMDVLFDLLNENELLDLTDLQENRADGTFAITAGDGTQAVIRCDIAKK